MGTEGNTATSSPSSSPVASPSRKRNRDLEDEVYQDNLHFHKRYLSEIMASSLNGLTVGESLSENLMYSPGRSESLLYARDDISSQYSPMSEDSDDSRFYENANTCPSQPESVPTSPVSPYRCQKPLSGFASGPATSSYYPLHGSPQSRQRGSDTDGRFPSSPSDICHSADLRKAALLRWGQLRSQPSGPLVQEPGGSNMEGEDRYAKASADSEREYPVAECSRTSDTQPQAEEKPSENDS